MAKIRIHAGDFLKGDGSFNFGKFVLRTQGHPWVGETIPVSSLEDISVASEDNVVKIGGKLGWGFAGAALLGPVGLLAGLLAGGRGKTVTFVARFVDGRKLLATTDSKTYVGMTAAVFDKPSAIQPTVAPQRSAAPSHRVKRCPICSAENSETSKFCNSCGSAAPQLPPPLPQTSKRPDNRGKLWLGAILGGIVFFLAVVLMPDPSKPEPQAPVPLAIPSDVTYTVTGTNIIAGVTKKLDIRLNRKVSEDVLRAIANKLKNSDDAGYERTLIMYYLPGMKVDEGAWATTHFDPDLKVEILGASIDDEKRAASNLVAHPGRVVVGRWLDEAYQGGQVIEIYREKGKLYYRNPHEGTGYTELDPVEMIERKSKLGRRFQDKEENSFGDFYILDKTGDLQGWDNQGFVRTMKAIDFEEKP